MKIFKTLKSEYLFLTILFIRLIYISFQHESIIVSYIPDDSFYYLELAKNFIETKSWTFDKVNPASGFHTLYAYLIVIIMLAIGADNFFSIFLTVSILNIILFFISFLITKRLVSEYHKINGNSFMNYLLLIPYLSFFSINNSTYIMEAPFTIFFSSQLIFLLFTKKSIPLKLILIFIVCFLGQLFRYDFGLHTLASLIYFIGYFIKNKKIIYKFLIPILGSSIALLIQILHNFLYGISFPPSSSLVKSYWASTTTLIYDIKEVLEVIIRDISISMGYIDGYLNLFFLFAIIILSVYKSKKSTISRLNIYGFSLVTFIIYFLFYLLNGAVQNWYIQNFHVYITLIVFVILKSSFEVKLNNRNFLKAAIIISLLTNIYSSLIPEYNQNMIAYHQAYNLDNDHEKVGSFNAGILGYFSKKTQVINLDGLVNDNAAKYFIKNNIKDYMIKNNINILSDFILKDTSLIKRVENFNSTSKSIRFHKSIYNSSIKEYTHYIYSLDFK